MGEVRSFLFFAVVVLSAAIMSSGHANTFNTQCSVQANAPDKRLTVLYFYLNNHEESFWHLHQQFTQAAAKSLGIDLISVAITEEYRHRIAYLELVEKHVNAKTKPDAAIGIFYAKGEANLLDLYEKYKVPFFSVNTSLDEPTLAQLTLPRDRYKYWVGHLAPDDFQAGYDLAVALNGLVERPLSMVAMGGSLQSAVSNNRRAGYLAAAEKIGFNIMPSFYTDWSREHSRMVVNKALERLPDIDVIWTAGPDIAKGALTSLQGLDEKRRSGIRLGTFDWSRDVVDMMERGQLEVSYGGHFAEGAWALIMLVDYLNGIDFIDDIGVKFNTQLEALTQNNVGKYADFIKEQKWQDIEFTKYSKCHTPTLGQYHFSATHLLEH